MISLLSFVEEYLANLTKKYFFSIRGLLTEIFLIILVLVYYFDAFMEKGIKIFLIRLFIYLGICILWFILWIYLRNYFPKNKKGKIGIVMAIKTESKKQKVLIKSDFIKGVKKQLRRNNMLNLFHFIVLQDYKANKAGDILQDYVDRKIEYIRKDIFKDFHKTVENKKYERLNKEINGHFYVWGTIKKRQDVQPKYFITIDSLVVHRPISLKTSNQIAIEFLKIFPKEISFYETLEAKGFEVASSDIFMAIGYITGIAAFVSGDNFLAYELHCGLKNEINGRRFIPPNLEVISKKVKQFLYIELIQQAHYFYQIKNDLEKYKEVSAKAEELNDKGYAILVINSIIAFQIERNPVKSIQYLKKAKRVSKGDYTWLYNIAFVYMYLEKFDFGFKYYKRLRGLSFPGEDAIVDQCINFNEDLLKNEPEKKQSLFILAYLYFTKKENLPMALENFEKFTEVARADSKYNYLYTRAVTYISEINKKMELKK